MSPPPPPAANDTTHRALIRSTLARVRFARVPLAAAVVLAELVVIAAMAPLSGWMVQRLIARTGRYAVANTELVGFALSPIGAASLTMMLVFWLVGRFFCRTAGMTAIRSGSRKLGAGVMSLFEAVRSLPTVAVVAFWQTLGLIVTAMPFLLVLGVIAWLVVDGVELYWLVTVRPMSFWVGVAAAVPVALAGAAVVGWRLLSWSIALPICLFEGIAPREAMRLSRQRLAGRMRQVILMRLGWTGLSLVLTLMVLKVMRLAAIEVLGGLSLSLETMALVAGAVMLAITSVAAVMSWISSAGMSAIVERLWMLDRTDTDPTRHEADASKFSGSRFRMAVCAGVAGVILVGTGGAYGLIESVNRPIHVELTAHRGAQTVAPENTLAALHAAVEAGADRVELDVMRTRDGAVIVFHDTDLRRIAGDPRRIADLTLDEVRQIDAGKWFDARFEGERIPTLDELLTQAAGRTTLNIELKPVGDAAELAEAVIGLLRKHSVPDLNGRTGVIITSLSPDALAAVRRLDSSIPVGLVLTVALGDVRRTRVDLLSIESRLASDSFITRAHETGLDLHVWKIDDRDALTKLALAGVEGIITSDVRPLRERLDELHDMDDLERLSLALKGRLLAR